MPTDVFTYEDISSEVATSLRMKPEELARESQDAIKTLVDVYNSNNTKEEIRRIERETLESAHGLLLGNAYKLFPNSEGLKQMTFVVETTVSICRLKHARWLAAQAPQVITVDLDPPTESPENPYPSSPSAGSNGLSSQALHTVS